MKETKHIPKYCNIKDCKEEAYSWLTGTEGENDFYLCNNHHHELKIEDGDKWAGSFVSIDEYAKIRHIEVGIYACSEQCATCNDFMTAFKAKE